MPLNFDNKEFGMVYVGNNWFRWRSLRRVLDTIEPVLQYVGRIAIVGNGWDRPAPWAKPVLPEDAYRTDPEYLMRLGIQVMPPIRFDGQPIDIRLSLRRTEDGIWRGRIMFGAEGTELERSSAEIFCASSEQDLWQSVRDLRDHHLRDLYRSLL